MAAERIFIAGAVEILKKLSSFPEEEINLIRGMKKEFKKLKETFSMIQAVLKDAETRQEKDEVIKLWLKRLKDVVYEVDDLLDEFSFEGVGARVEIQNPKKKKVSDFFSRKNPILFRSRMAHKIKDINEKLDKIERDMKMFNFKIGDVNDQVMNYIDRATDARIDNSQIFGREKEKAMVIDMLIGGSSNEDDLSVIPIVGIGGIGKTTLAKMVYNDESVVAYFEKRMWICVADNFEVRRLIMEMLECLTGVNPNLSNLEAIQYMLDQNLKGKRFLLVLDDVWNRSHDKWDKLRASLVIGAKGSKIVVTTRNIKVASIMGTVPSQHLTALSENESWSLFEIKAFRSGGATTANSNMVRIAKILLEKCKGVPLAIKSASSLMHSQRINEHEWLNIQDSELWKEAEEDEDGNGILSVLKLSYDYWSSPLKQCFAYCSIFPKDYRIDKKTLIQLWMAEGLLQIQSSSSSTSSTITSMMEDIGDKYFKSLVWNSFFHEVERDENGEEVACKMHDLVHDLAQSIIGNEYMIVEDFSKVEPNPETRYLSLVGRQIDTIPETFYIMNKVRAHLYLDRGSHDYRLYHISDDMLFNFRSLRVLSLNGAGIDSLPSSIENLKHLRYLDLMRNKFETFPESPITNLCNLQTLKIHVLDSSGKRMPKGITKMITLRHLEIGDGWIYPKGIGRLTHLQTLEFFSASSEGERDTEEEAAGFEELENLRQLGGFLQIFDLIRCLKKNASAAKLREKPRLKKLRLMWSPWYLDETVNGIDFDNSLLESLQPHRNLVHLEIFRFTGTKIPTWMDGSSYLSSLRHLCIDGCDSIKSLDLVGLSSLRMLVIESCRDLTSLGLLKGLTALEVIRLKECQNLMSIGIPEDGMPDLISLKSLNIEQCYNLATLPDGFFRLLTSLNTLLVSDCSLRILPPSIGYLSSLRQLYIKNCRGLELLPESFENLLTLEKLEMEQCPALVTLPQSLRNLLALQVLVIVDCPCVVALPEGLDNLRSLRQLSVKNCRGLELLPRVSKIS